MADRVKEELERLERELRRTSEMTRSMTASQQRLTNTLTRKADFVTKSIAGIIQGIRFDTEDIKLKEKSIQLKQRQLDYARAKLKQDERHFKDAEKAHNDFKAANKQKLTDLHKLGTQRTQAQNDELKTLLKDNETLAETKKKARTAYQKSTDAVDKFTNQIELKSEEVKNLKFGRMAEGILKVADTFEGLVASVRKTQQQFGISAARATEINFSNLKSSVDSFASALLPGGKSGPGVTMEQIAQAQQDFQDQFGGLLTSEAATKMAQEAVKMGVTTEQLATARRVFLTQTRGDANKAQEQTDKFVSEFAKKGLSSKVAMQEIAKNSELLAKNGARFSTQMIRALADAKKIGVELSKISQFGDNLINDFEGFLESQAELGAMGFGFDSSRLAEIAETGDDAALFDELRSQLAATGKDITKLRRSERLALENAFGLNISDMLAMSGETVDGGGEDTVDLQKKTNEWLSTAVDRAEATVKAVQAVASGIGLANILLRLIERNTKFGNVTNIPDVDTGSRGQGPRGKGTRLRARSRLARRFFSRSKLGKRILSSRIATRVGSSKFASVASKLATKLDTSTKLPLSKATRLGGRLFGAAAGLYSGYQTYQQERAEGTGKGTAATAAALSTGGAFGGAYGGALLGAKLGAIGGPWGIAIGGFLGGLGGAILGDKLASWVNTNITKRFSTALDSAGNSVGKMWDSFTSWFSTKPAAAKPKVSTGDDVIAKPGYGKRSLVTPAGIIALNDKDNIIAYADDLVGTEKRPYGSIAQSAKDVAKDTVVTVTRDTAAKAAGKAISNATARMATNAIPLLGDVVSAIMVANDEYKTTKDLKKSIKVALGYYAASAVGGAQAATLASPTGPGAVIAEAVGSALAGEAYLKGRKITYADDLVGSKKLPIGTISKLMSRTGAKDKGLNLLNSRVPGFSKYMPEASNLIGTYRQGGTGGLKDYLTNRGVGMATRKAPMVADAMDVFSAYKTGGVRGALGSLAKGGIGKFIGGALGSAIPIPGVGTMIGSMMGSKVGKFVGGLFGKKKQTVPQITPEMMTAGNLPNLAAMLAGGMFPQSREGTTQQPTIKVDTSGIEQKLNNFINALQGIQINMDGNKVGKVLVNTAEIAASTGVFRVQSR